MKESLRDRLLRGAPLPVEEAVQIAVQISPGWARRMRRAWYIGM